MARVLTETPVTLNIRGVTPGARDLLNRTGGARGYSQAETLRALLGLLEVARVRAAYDPAIQRLLADCGLEEVAR